MIDLTLAGAMVLALLSTISLLLVLTEWFTTAIKDTPENNNLFDLDEDDLP